jgi:hypothetical protein
MEPWYNVFSYWGFVLLLLRPWLPFSILSILAVNLAGMILFAFRARPSFRLGLFLTILHALPVWMTRRESFDVVALLGVFTTYTLFLGVQGLTPIDVYESLINDPPGDIRDYLARRLLLKS